MMTREEKKHLQWFLDFMYVDFAAIPDTEVIEWHAALNERLGLSPYHGEEDFFGDDASEELLAARREMSQLCRKLETFMNEMVTPAVADAKDSIEARSVNSTSLVKKHERIVVPAKTFSFNLKLSTFISAEIRRSADSDRQNDAVRSEKIRIEVSSAEERNAQAVLFQFLIALNGVSLGELGQCTECARWYVRVTEHSRGFCSRKCASRYGQREKRRELKQNPERYEEHLIKEQDRLHEVYKRKRKKEAAGQKVKVERRPRK